MRQIKTILITSILLSPMLAFAATSDNTFIDIFDKIAGYLTGSLGLVFVILSFMGAAAAVAGFASMKVMFPVFGLCLALHYGPSILQTIFGATSDIPTSYYFHPRSFTIYDLALLMLSATVFIFGHYKNKKETV